MASLDSTGIPPGIIMEASERNIAVSSEPNAADSGTVILESSDNPLLPEEGDAQERLRSFWQRQLEDIQNLSNNEFKIQELPLARIKKIMKMDEDVKMISAEAPLLFSKAAQIFITELSLRAWVHTEESKRRTLQRNDIATAITKFDQFDFLIDIVPREELKPVKRTSSSGGASSDLQQFFYTVPQQQQTNAVTATTNTNPSITGVQSAQQVSALQSGQLLIAQQTQNGQPMTLTPVNVDGTQLMQLTQVSQQGQSSQQVQGQPQAVVLNASSLNAGQMIVQDQRQQQQQVNTQNAQTIEQKQQQQNIQSVLQQLMGNASNAQGEVHTIQMNSQGQLQLVKVVNPQQQQQQQQNLSANSGIATRQDITAGNQVFTISESSAAQTSDGTSTIYVNPAE